MILLATVEAELTRRLEKALPGEPDDLPLLTRLAARMEPAMRRAFLAAVRGAADVVNISDLVDAVRSGQVSQIEAAAQLEELSPALRRLLLPVLGRLFALGVQVGEDQLGDVALTIAFDLSNPEAIAWVQSHGASLVTDVTDGTRSAIRALVDVAFREGRSPDQLAREIREVIGLTERQMEAVQAFRERLWNEGVEASEVERRAARYADAQLRYRAEMIARTETLEASNEGQQQLWEHARAQGLLNPEKTRRVWIVTPDGRLCDLCEPMDGEEATLGGTFKGGVRRPPRHPQCRCTTGLVFKE